jgi:hypothetical protein
MVKSNNAGAYFSSSLMGAAMCEAMLALMCLVFETDVRETRQFHHSTKKLNTVIYRSVVSNWSFEQFICVSEECNWIPANIVEKDIITGLADGFRELMPMSHPEMSEEEIERGAATFLDNPGSAILRMTQTLRNSIHAGSWLRRRTSFDADAFEGWCRLAISLSAEIRLCLMHQFMSRVGNVANVALEKLKQQIAQLPEEALPFIEAEMREKLNSPSLLLSDFDSVVSAMLAADKR